MPHCHAVLGLFVALWLVACGHDAPTAARSKPAAARAELVELAVALEDVRSRILPALGDGPAIDDLAGALGDVERTLARPDVALLEAALARANEAALRIPADSALLPDRDIVFLVLAHITAVAHAPADDTRGNP